MDDRHFAVNDDSENHYLEMIFIVVFDNLIRKINGSKTVNYSVGFFIDTKLFLVGPDNFQHKGF